MAFPTRKLISDHGGAEILINTQTVSIKKPDKLVFLDDTQHSVDGIIPGESVDLSMNDIHNITKVLREKFGVDISKDDYRQQIRC